MHFSSLLLFSLFKTFDFQIPRFSPISLLVCAFSNMRNAWKGEARRTFNTIVDKGFLATYQKLLRTRPLVTKSVTSMILVGAGDVITQAALEPKFDRKRFTDMAIIGGGFIGPSLHYWYTFLNATVTTPGFRGALVRLAMDQIVFAPICVASFFACVYILQNRLDVLINPLSLFLMYLGSS